MKCGLEWIRDNWVYFMPFVSWFNRPYHWMRDDETNLECINRDTSAIAGNVVLVAVLLIVIIVDALL